MWENLIVSLNAVVPMFLIIGLGYFVRSRKMVDEPELRKFNNVAFRIFLPCQLFKNVFDSDLERSFNLKLVVFTVLCILLVYLLALVSVLLTEKLPQRRGVMIQAIFRSNFILLGIPLVSSIYGAENLGAAPVMIAIVVPLFNVLAVITLEVFHSSKVRVGQVLLDIVKNPLIISSLLGLGAKLLGLPLYSSAIFSTTLGSLSQVATPLMLFILGGSFQFSSVRSNGRRILFCALGKLIVVPAIAFSLGAAIGLRGSDLAVLLGVFASPPAANSYTMAQQMGGDADLAANLVVIGTAASCFTMFCWILLLKQTGLV